MNLTRPISTRRAAYWTAGFGLIVIFASAGLYLFDTTGLDIHQPLNVEAFESYGAFVGGLVAPLFALAGLWLVLATLDDQRATFRRQQIEARFFQLLSVARENSEAVGIGGRSGRKVFISFTRELAESYRITKRIGSSHGIGSEHFPNLAYLAFFYGAVGRRSIQVLRRRLAQRYPRGFLNALFAEYALQAKAEAEHFFYKPFCGHQSRLGHYYRHLYQTVTFINGQPNSVLTYPEKYDYVKTLRAQLSTHEQLIFFWNSISDVGQKWELSREDGDANNRLITKYNLVKNIPEGFSIYANPRSYYPSVAYEGLKNPPPERARLLALYQ